MDNRTKYFLSKINDIKCIDNEYYINNYKVLDCRIATPREPFDFIKAEHDNKVYIFAINSVSGTVVKKLCKKNIDFSEIVYTQVDSKRHILFKRHDHSYFIMFIGREIDTREHFNIHAHDILRYKITRGIISFTLSDNTVYLFDWINMKYLGNFTDVCIHGDDIINQREKDLSNSITKIVYNSYVFIYDRINYKLFRNIGNIEKRISRFSRISDNALVDFKVNEI